MNGIRWNMTVWLTAGLAVATAAHAQVAKNDPHIGYVFPAGGRVGTTFRATVGGQHLDGVSDICVSGNGIHASVVKHTKPLTQRQVNELREKLRQAREKAQAGHQNSRTPTWVSHFQDLKQQGHNTTNSRRRKEPRSSPVGLSSVLYQGLHAPL